MVSKIAQFSAGSVMTFTLFAWLMIGIGYLIGTTYLLVAVYTFSIAIYLSKTLRFKLRMMISRLMRIGRKFFLVPSSGDI